jgi:hypothetical protein
MKQSDRRAMGFTGGCGGEKKDSSLVSNDEW